MGRLAMALDRVNRPIALRNLEIAFPETGVGRRLEILRSSYENWGRMVAEWTHFEELGPHNADRYVSYEGWSHFENAKKLSAGRGILVLTAHFGNFELQALAFSLQGEPLAIVQRPVRNPLIDRQVQQARVRFGNLVVARKRAAMRMRRLLREDWMVAVALDLDVRRGIFVKFFSLAAATSDGLARLSMATGASVLPAFIVRQGDGLTHRTVFLPPVEVRRDGDHRSAVAENTQRFASIIEEMIRRHPDHWNWIHRRWKTRPPGERRFY